MLEPSGRTALYRLYGATGSLLYVGISVNPEARLKAHRWGPDRQPWRLEIASQAVEWYDTRQQARAAEVAAIRAELPQHNRRHHPAFDCAPWSSRKRKTRPRLPVITHPSTMSWG